MFESSNSIGTIELDSNTLSHPHPIHNNMVPCSFAGNNITFPIPTATGKQPKPKNQTPSQPKDGLGQLTQPPSS